MRLAVEDWNNLGWAIVDNDGGLDDGTGGLAYYNRLFAYGFADEYDARLWVTVFELQRASGVMTTRQDFSGWKISSG